jgi:hypothetical protein
MSFDDLPRPNYVKGERKMVTRSRIFVGWMAVAILVFASAQPNAAQRALPGPGPDQDALNVLRTLNTIQAVILGKTYDKQHPEIRKYGSRQDMLGDQKPGIAWQLDNPLQSDPLLTKLHPDSPTGEVLLGWILDFASKPNGYVIALVEKTGASRKVFVTDETGVIYRTDVAENTIPSLKSIQHASEYSPGIVDFDRYYSQKQAH